MTDSQGRVVSFKNTIIIMTSNLGSAAVLEVYGDKQQVCVPAWVVWCLCLCVSGGMYIVVCVLRMRVLHREGNSCTADMWVGAGTRPNVAATCLLRAVSHNPRLPLSWPSLTLRFAAAVHTYFFPQPTNPTKTGARHGDDVGAQPL